MAANKASARIYLDELLFLGRIMALQSDRLRKAAIDWGPVFTTAAVAIRRMMAGDRSADTPEYRNALEQVMAHQDEVLMALDGFLAAWSRASLILWPAPRGPAALRARAEARGAYLCEMMRIDESHVLHDRELRDHWVHYDERLDAALEEYGANVQSLDFTTRLLPQGGFVMWQFDLSALELTFRGEHRYQLVTLFDAVEDLRSRAGGAIYEHYALPRPQ